MARGGLSDLRVRRSGPTSCSPNDRGYGFPGTGTFGLGPSYDAPVSEIRDPGLRGSVDHLMTQVTPDNVLAVRRVLLNEANELYEAVARYDRQVSLAPTGPGAEVNAAGGRPGAGFEIGLCSGDPVSQPAAISFNRKIRKIVDGYYSYIADLFAAADQLRTVARNYRLSEDQISASFHGLTSIPPRAS